MGWQRESHLLDLDALMDPSDDYTRFSGVSGQRFFFLSFSSCELLILTAHQPLQGDDSRLPESHLFDKLFSETSYRSTAH